MKEYIVKEYEMEDYDLQRKKIAEMSNEDLANAISDIARGWLPDYNFTGSEDDFEQHKYQMIMYEARTRLENMSYIS